ncbi:MAG: efflux RND transporter periplasmic adaptor subunit [Candidatus Omnitrophica bacterium]|nr:efflux RND transporter periplasmic adaptor subunit [Candidatus Omnitrophota bacterium]
MHIRPDNGSLFALAAIPLLWLAGGCGKAGGPPSGGMPVQVVGFKAEIRPIQDTISLTGSLEANEWVEIKSQIEGVIEEILFEEGQTVKEGQLLLRIDRRKLEAQLAEAQANLKLTDSNRRRYEALSQTRAVSKQEVDQAVAAFEAAQATVSLLKARLEDADIAAPFDGVTGARLVSPGQFIAAGTPLTTLLHPDPMKAEFRVPERHLSRLQEGQEVEVAVAAYPDERFTGTVYFIDPQIDEATRTALVKARVPNPEGKLRRGMFVNLNLILQVREKAVVIPEIALTLQGDAASVFVVDETSSAQIRQVQTGARLADAVEILSGVSEGETVVIEGTQKVRPGGKVQVRYEEKASP